jgi:hypothetical protein
MTAKIVNIGGPQLIACDPLEITSGVVSLESPVTRFQI